MLFRSREEVVRDIPFITVDQDRTELSRKLIHMADAHDSARWEGEAADPDEAKRMIADGSAAAVLVIPEGFERGIRRGRGATVAAWADASYFLLYRNVLTAMSEAAGTLSAGIELRSYAARGKPSVMAEALSDPVQWSRRSLFNPAMGYGVYIVPGVLILILQQTLLIGVMMATLKMRSRPGRLESGEHALSSAGRFVFYLVLYSIHAAIYCLVIFRLNGIPLETHFLTIWVFLLPYFLSVYQLACFMSRWIRRRETALQLVLFTSMPILFASGFAWPLESIPAWIRMLSMLIPSTSGISGFIRMSRMGADLHDVALEWGMLWTLAGVYFLARRVSVRKGIA